MDAYALVEEVLGGDRGRSPVTTNGRIVFGELTSFPAGGDSPFFPESFDDEFGRPWTVPRRYR